MVLTEREVVGKIYDIQGMSVHDGPGVRTTVFLKGCPLHCLWCHSPESQMFRAQMSYTALRCIGTELCGECLKVCRHGALAVYEGSQPAGEKSVVRWDRKACQECGACAERCFPGALSMCGKDYTVEEVLEILRKDYAFFRASSGGVTVSGGEALSQIAFTEALLRAGKADGIHTAVDTTGFAPPERVERVLPWTDLFLYDLKHMDSEAHKRATGVPNEQILSNARLIAQRGGKLQIRIPVIPGFNDAKENLERTAEFCRSLGDAVELVQLLPFHHFGASKYERIQMQDPMPDWVQPPSDEEMAAHLELVKAYGLNAIIH